jgi:integrase/recombinase XerD
VPTREPENFDSLQEAFVEELRVHRYSKSAQDQARDVLPRLFSHLRDEGVSDIQEVAEKHLVSFFAKLRQQKNRYGEPLSLGTQSTYFYRVKRFFSFLDRRSIILRDPARCLRAPKVKRLPRVLLTEEEVQKLLEAPPPHSATGLRDRAMIEILYGTAIRRGECLRLNLSDVDLHGRTLLVRDGKGKKDRFVPIPGKTAEVLSRYLEDARPSLVHDPGETALFLGRWGRRPSASLLDISIRRYAKAAGIRKPVHPHALRRACATHLLRRGADIRHLQELLGHASVETTALYTQVEIGDLRKAVRAAHPRERVRRPVQSTPRKKAIK